MAEATKPTKPGEPSKHEIMLFMIIEELGGVITSEVWTRIAATLTKHEGKEITANAARLRLLQYKKRMEAAGYGDPDSKEKGKGAKKAAGEGVKRKQAGTISRGRSKKAKKDDESMEESMAKEEEAEEENDVKDED